ncbi:ribosome maturation factor RimP [Anseongella ginsenosidimutans]|uniref:Ribosome maturation factor RimP n=1 Tax=Anseongella ginsenosidimutans TaxID=496056 RepID=A0A4R3KVZ2_9SPHI|nr:ribosome maturation factor RimP [Anseongella ginsenosidimutans]QEC51396.1 ribosome maturation factor RimP [Anseongella ginsenosidimutans]TCS89899.1 ribosome maturation factor RimP [Anseongella ginsenosidimutans]
MDSIQRITELVEEKIAGTDLFIVEIRLQANRLQVFIDGDKGVSIEACAAVSRHVGHAIEEENLIEQAYTLEVSSPGLDAPLKLKRQFVKNTGRMLALKMQDGKRRTGRLVKVTEEAMVLEEKIKDERKKTVLVESELPFSEISEAKVTIN